MKSTIFSASVMIAATSLSSEPMTFKKVQSGGSCNSCVWTMAEGEITASTPDHFQQYLSREIHPGRIVFHSSGGNLGAAVRLGRAIRQARLNTSVGQSKLYESSSFEYEIVAGQCDSACFFAFAGGLTRAIDDGTIGVHPFFRRDGGAIPSEDTQRVIGQVLLYLIDMKINTEILSIASRTPANAMLRLDVHELIALGLLHKRGLTGPNLRVRSGGLQAEWTASQSDGSLFRTVTLRCSQEHKAWRLTVRDHDPLIDELPFAPEKPTSMGFAIGQNRWDGEDHALQAHHILDSGRDSEGLFVDVVLPLDLRTAAARPFAFETTSSNNFRSILSAHGNLPDADTLDVLVRACGD